MEISPVGATLRHTDRETGRQADRERETGGQRDRQAGRQTERERDRRTERQAGRQRERERQADMTKLIALFAIYKNAPKHLHKQTLPDDPEHCTLTILHYYSAFMQ
jgi:hypothetical protein